MSDNTAMSTVLEEDDGDDDLSGI